MVCGPGNPGTVAVIGWVSTVTAFPGTLVSVDLSPTSGTVPVATMAVLMLVVVPVGAVPEAVETSHSGLGVAAVVFHTPVHLRLVLSTPAIKSAVAVIRWSGPARD